MVRKELLYEYTAFPPASEALKCLCNRLKIKTYEESMGGAFIASTKDGSLHVRLATETSARGGMKVVVKIRVVSDDHLTAIISCFGDPKEEHSIAPSALSFAEAVMETKLDENIERFVETVCYKLGIEKQQFGIYRAMVLTGSRMSTASEIMKKAAKKLQEI